MRRPFVSWLLTTTFAAVAFPWPTPTLAQEELTQATVTRSVNYICDGGKTFLVEYRSDRSVEATFGSKVLVLTPVEAASGATYSDGKATLNTQGDEAFVAVGDKRLFTNCVVQTTDSQPSGRAMAAGDTSVVINNVAYRCDDGKGFRAKYRTNDTVEATFGSKVIVLPQVQSGSGARYSDDKVTLHTKGNEAFVEVGDQRLFNNCVAIQPIEGLW